MLVSNRSKSNCANTFDLDFRQEQSSDYIYRRLSSHRRGLRGSCSRSQWVRESHTLAHELDIMIFFKKNF